MNQSRRIRVVFKDDDILNETQKLEGLNRSWVLLKADQHGTISDIASHLLHAFQLHRSCPHGLLLSISGFILPRFESTCILKDNEIVRVRKRRDPLCLEGNHAASEVQKLKAAGKRPIDTGVLLLANEEFEKEKGGYESDDPDEESEEGDQENFVKDTTDIKNRKRKAPERLQGSNRKKKQRSDSRGDVVKKFHTESVGPSNQDVEQTKKKTPAAQEKRTVSDADDEVGKNEGNAKLSDNSDVPMPEVNRDSEVQENRKETEEAKDDTKPAKKGPSRSARRKYAKRRFKREMAKIQKKNAVCESESLRNWKEDQAKAEKNKQKWKRNRSDAETNVVDGQPKGLLHWKQSPQSNHLGKGKRRQQRNQDGSFHKYPKQNGDFHRQPKQNDKPNQNDRVHEHPNQTGDVHEQPNERIDDVQEQPNIKDGAAQEKPNQKNDEALEQTNFEDVEENEIVPIVIRPGHIRFEPLGEEQAVQQSDVPLETFQWNGITSKKKGQKWGKENSSFTARNDYRKSTKGLPRINEKETQEVPGILSNEKEKLPGGIDFDKLPPLPSMPKEGDIIAYRILELSSTWTPELSPFRVGKVSRHDAESNHTVLVPLAEYPIVSQNADDNEDVLPNDNALYKDDGSLEIDFSSLVDVRIFKDGSAGPRNEASSFVNGQNHPKTVVLGGDDEQTVLTNPANEEQSQAKETEPCTAENGGADLWDQISGALNAKKEQLRKESSWGKTPPKKVQPPQVNSWGENANNAHTNNSWGTNATESTWGKKAEENTWGKNGKNVQLSQQKSRDKQNTGGKSWSYKALRGSALGPTMAMLRSKTDA